MNVNPTYLAENCEFCFSEKFNLYNLLPRQKESTIDDLVLDRLPQEQRSEGYRARTEKKRAFLLSWIGAQMNDLGLYKLEYIQQLAKNINFFSKYIFYRSPLNHALEDCRKHVNSVLLYRSLESCPQQVIPEFQQRLKANQEVIASLKQLAASPCGRPRPYLPFRYFFTDFNEKLTSQAEILEQLKWNKKVNELAEALMTIKGNTELDNLAEDYLALREKTGCFEHILKAVKEEVLFLNDRIAEMACLMHHRTMLVNADKSLKQGLFFMRYNYKADQKFESKSVHKNDEAYSILETVNKNMNAALPDKYPFYMPNLMKETGTPPVRIETSAQFKEMVSVYSEYFEVLGKTLSLFQRKCVEASTLIPLLNGLIFDILKRNEKALGTAFAQNRELLNELFQKNGEMINQLCQERDVSLVDLIDDGLVHELLLSDDEILMKFLSLK